MINSWFAIRFSIDIYKKQKKIQANTHFVYYSILYLILKPKCPFALCVYLYIGWLAIKKKLYTQFTSNTFGWAFFPYICFSFEVNHHWSNKGFFIWLRWIGPHRKYWMCMWDSIRRGTRETFPMGNSLFLFELQNTNDFDSHAMI